MTEPKKPKGNKVPKKSLLVTVSYNPEVNDLQNYLVSSIIEYMGIYLEHKRSDPQKHSIVGLFDKAANGEDYFNIMNNTDLEVSKEES